MSIEKGGGNVCVIGAGFVGCAAALALHRLGLSVDILDRRQNLSLRPNDSRAIVLSHTSKRLLQLLNLWGTVEKESHPIREIQVSEAGYFGGVTLKAEDAGLEVLGWSCEASFLLSQFQASLLGTNTIRAYWNANVDDMRFDKDWTIGYKEKDGEVKIRADLLLATDGSESIVRENLQLAIDNIDYEQSAVVSTVETQKDSGDVAFLRFFPKGSLALIPNASGKFVSIHCLHQNEVEQVKEYDDQGFLGFIERNFGKKLGDFISCSERKYYSIRRLSAKELTRDRCVLLGNAANTLHPNAAQGLNLGFRDVLALEKSLASFSLNIDKALADYRIRRRADHFETCLYSDLLVQSFSSEIGPIGIGRRAMMNLVNNVSPLKRKFILRGTGLLPTLSTP